MFGGRSIQLFRVFGIRIGVDLTWFFVLFLVIWWMSQHFKDIFPGQDTKAFLLAVVSALVFFASVVLHELGHALVAVRSGIGIAGIDLWMFGGVARMSSDTRTPGQELRVAIAGPLVTLVIAAVCYGAGQLVDPGHFTSAAELQQSAQVSTAGAVLSFLAFINFALLVFNLLPGFPLDGGRVARAILWWRIGDRDRATHYAALLGRGLGYLLIAYGLYSFVRPTADTFGGLWTAAIGLMLSQAARAEEMSSRIKSHIAGLRVADVMDAEPVVLPAETRLDRALEDYFLRYRWPWFPVVDVHGRFLGFASRQRAEAVPEALRAGTSVDQVMTVEDAGRYRVGMDEPLEALLGSEGLQRLGALMAVDREGVLRGIVTLDQLRRALQAPAR
ncbi:MAG: site-2 protease family protein [Actinobacteria bacterium]|nr:site-2 protease family protein [Actinomycetota bacterium]